MTDEGRPALYRVVVNQRGQHSVWPADNTPPLGWTASGASATRADCLARIAAEWHDIRPGPRPGACGDFRSAPDPRDTADASATEHEG